GTYQVEIHRDGFKTYLTSVDITPSEKQSLRVVLEPVGAGAAAGDSTLVITSTPNGADIELDGAATQLHTPAKLDVKPGPHVIVLRQNGIEKWRQEFVAERNSNAEFGAVLTDERVRERAQRRGTWVAPTGLDSSVALGGDTASKLPTSDKTDAAISGARAGSATGSTTGGTDANALVPSTDSGSAAASGIPLSPDPPISPATPPPTTSTGSGAGTGAATPPPSAPSTPTTSTGGGTPAIIAPPTQPATATTPLVAKPPTPTAPTEPPLLRPNSLPRISGEMPTFSSASSEDLPSSVSSKVCVDSGGKVTAIAVLSKLETDARKAIEAAMRTWRYTPYRDKNVALAACFIVTFRLK
ncbi:MAG: PEGA domain-containing protein, partial [Kofleriaceae bacterium]|nr:PEGA domain-containing protein [Kofleriaceae bacterium]